MFEDLARTWLKNRSGIKFDGMVLNELAEDLAIVLKDIYEAGYSCGYEEGLEENLSELQW